jgi:hypothetical protein
VVQVKGQQRYNGVVIIAKNDIKTWRDAIDDIPFNDIDIKAIISGLII